MLLDQVVNAAVDHARARYALIAQRNGYGGNLGPLLTGQVECLDARCQSVLLVLAGEKYDSVVARVVENARVEANGERRITYLTLICVQVDYERLLRQTVFGGELAAHYEHLLARLTLFLEHTGSRPFEHRHTAVFEAGPRVLGYRVVLERRLNGKCG